MSLMSQNAARSEVAPWSGTAPAMRAATVMSAGEDGMRVAIDGRQVRASCAVSCPAEPFAGDEVLVWAGEDACHILAILRRAGPADDGQTRPCETGPEEVAPEPAFAGPFTGLPSVMADGNLPYQPHFDSQSDGEAAAGRPWTRFDVPLTPNAFGSGTYFRMGAYVDGQEGVMMPPLQLSKSTATTTTKTAPTPDFAAALLSGKNAYNAAAETANAATATSASTTGTASGDAKQGYLKRGDSFVKNKVGQMELQTIATTAVTTTSSGDGFLAKTDADVNLSIDGGMLVDIVKGQTTNVADGDIKFTAPAGLFAVSALSGISLTAGTASSPANISLLAYGYVKNEAKGPVSEWFYSTSEKKTYGFAKDWFYGEKYSEFHGTSTSKFYGDENKTFEGTATSFFYGDQITTNHARRISMTMAATLTLALGTEFRLNAAIDLKINLALDMNIIIGIAFKMVVGFDTKVVLGSDFKYVSGLDIKWVGIDGKKFNFEIKQGDVDAYLGNLILRTGATDIGGKQVELKTGFFFRS
ncbi:DUF3540 domain-containing protein [Bosea sp. R86505]|uniref:DUF3540 domain-containing protein n=1 Tax=Bosea sp. R86505 TaxID=3101710 RepID=UPI00366FC600